MSKPRGRPPKAASVPDPVVLEDQVQSEKVNMPAPKAVDPLLVCVRNNSCRDYYEPSSRTEIKAATEVAIRCDTSMQKAQVLANIRQLSASKNHLEVLNA